MTVIRKPERPVIVSCPPFDDESGGCIALHYLAHRLRGVGCDAYVFPLLDELTPHSIPLIQSFRRASIIRDYVNGRRPFTTNPAFDTPLASPSALRRGIVVYPEIVRGNPLGCPYVVRWILYLPGGHGRGERFVNPIKGEEVFFFQNSFIQHIDWISRENCLRLQWHRGDIFHDPGAVERTEVCRMIRKGTATANSPPPGAEGAILLDGMSNADIAKIFKRSRLFYCHDPYTMYCDFAALCGCLPIVVPLPGVSCTEWRPESDRFGIAYGDSPDQRAWALRTRARLFERINEIKEQEVGMLEHFISRLASATVPKR